MLEYLNLAMNNIERIENTEPLESLEKLDLTLNFIGEITSVAVLKSNPKLKTLYLMGNPCAKFEFYKEYVIATLPQIEFLDGKPIDKSERIQAIQKLDKIMPKILASQNNHLIQREAERVDNEREIKEKLKEYDNPNLDLDTKRRNFYQSASKHTPEYRKESMRFREYLDEMDEKSKECITDDHGFKTRNRRKPTRFFDDQGRALNINEAQVDFHYNDSHDENIVIEIYLYKHLDSSLLELDVQPTYLRATIRGRIFQLRFLEEVSPDSGQAQRSQTTGHLVLTLPRAQGIVTTKKPSQSKRVTAPQLEQNEVLDVNDKKENNMDFSKIVAHPEDALDDLPELEFIGNKMTAHFYRKINTFYSKISQ